jgi:predicted nicotinamide N-methyase
VTIDRLDLVDERVEVAGMVFSLLRPRDLDALLADGEVERTQLIPYWAELWPSGRTLAENLPRSDPGRVIELGCGMGLPSLVGARRRWDVTGVDVAPDAVELLRLNARRNGTVVQAETVDWAGRQWFDDHGPWDLVLAADVLYERRHVEPLLQLLPRLAPEVLLADPGRQPLDDFLEGTSEQWSAEDVAPGVMRLRLRQGQGAQGAQGAPRRRTLPPRAVEAG